jgi:exodeoxyribonuclease VII large subunit
MNRDVYSVTRLNREVRVLMESALPAIWVEGELSNLSQPSSGHWYFTLKDAGAQIRCAMFRARNAQLGFAPKAGMLVQARGRVGLYEPRGDYQLIVEQLEEAGEGALKREFERLKERLLAEGLFAQERKRALPRLPRRVGIVTSATGAALRDLLHILLRRFPPAAVLIYPAPVQGAAAILALVEAIDLASERAEVDVLIVARGGGSLEDLWAFNDERVARSIHAASMPVVTGIGHETDFTIADFVADLRAPTPSGAAQLVVPDRLALLDTFASLAGRLQLALRRQLAHGEQRYLNLLRRLQVAHVGTRLTQQSQRLDELEQRMQLAWRARLAALGHRLALAQRGLDAVSPLATLARGFAIVTDAQGAVVTAATQLRAGATIGARLASGQIEATVIKVNE